MAEKHLTNSTSTILGLIIGSFVIYCWYSNLGVALSVQLFFKGVLFLGVVTLCIHYFTRIYQVYAARFYSRSQEDQGSEADDGVLKEQRKKAVKHSQDHHNEKTGDWYERVLRPREENKQREKEEKFYKNSKWKSPGTALGGEVVNRKSGKCTPEDAKSSRVLPERKDEIPSFTPPTKVKQVIPLPEEPDDGADDAITLIFRTPSGRKYQRRFYTHTKIQVIQNYITTIGYHKQLYEVYTSYPRKCITDNSNVTLKDMKIVKSSALNIEELDD